MVSAGSAWAVLARAGRTGHSSLLGRTLSENDGASWRKTTRQIAWKMIGADSWDSLMVSLALVGSLDTGTDFYKFKDKLKGYSERKFDNAKNVMCVVIDMEDPVKIFEDKNTPEDLYEY